MPPLIKLSLKSFAEFMTAGPTRQRKVLFDAKYPDEDEATARIVYYREAREAVAAFHAGAKDRKWLLDQADRIDSLATASSGRTVTRLRHNSRGMRDYARHFAMRNLQVLKPLQLALVFGNVRVSVVPDLHVEERGKEKIVKLEFSKDPPLDPLSKIVSQAMYEAARGAVTGLSGRSVVYVDVARGRDIYGARAGARTLRDMEAASQNIEAIWPSV